MDQPRQGSGLTDKLYWRQLGANEVWHCFKRLAGGGGKPARCVALCGRAEIPRSYGQGCRRPPPLLRCGRCDGLEANRRGWDESGPDSPDWRTGEVK